MDLQFFMTVSGTLVIVYIALRYYMGWDLPTITNEQASPLLKGKGSAIILDIRSKEEYKAQRAKNAINIPVKELPQRIEELRKYEDKLIIVMDQKGLGSKKVVRTLIKKDFPYVASFHHGFYA
ncbi:rhodanese-like domain-containing protein [Heliorestis convoluta]|uniref:Rhodanese-like domain-containing protein n=1 Tax=Heliorestis convoluta TaxID=356322 RepID=A0A5Q2N0H4_9FIRM|nr:rhodanese-like domain-containing protein [Heliorestis convoluta]QGG47279.1 rhodanese-like domain-containing protein [Heliorestis convoluta]